MYNRVYYNTVRRRINELFLQARFLRRQDALVRFLQYFRKMHVTARIDPCIRSFEAAWHAEKFIRRISSSSFLPLYKTREKFYFAAQYDSQSRC